MFTFGGDAPNLFGRNIYIVRTDTIEDLKPGTALLTSSVSPDEIIAGDIVIFKSSDNRAGIAEIVSVRVNDNVYGFSAVSERGADITLTQSQIVGKATQYSNFLGGLIGFAKSPAGVFVIAVIPCMIVLIFEASKFVFALFKKDGEITPVKKQDEIPTYIPRQKISAAMNAYSKIENSEVAETEEKEDFPLFTSPASKVIKTEKPEPRKPRQIPVVPLSQKKLNDAIKEVNARKAAFPYDNEEKAGFTAADFSEAVTVKKYPEKAETLKSYTPKKKSDPRSQRVSQTASIPSLDKLLRDDESEADNKGYNIEDILFSLDRKK